MEKRDNLELIHKYFRDELNPQEQEAFLQLQQDPAFLEEVAEFEFFHDLLEAGSLMEEEEAFTGEAAAEPGLQEPQFAAATPGSLSKPLQAGKENQSKTAPPTASHKPPTLQLRFSRVVRYALAASVLLLLAVGLTFYVINRSDRQQQFAAPLIAAIAYQEESDNTARNLEMPDTTFTVKLYPSVEGYPFHYLFRVSDTLRLYGTFNPKELMLQYNESRQEYRLTYKDKIYLLERKKEISPLIPAKR